MYWKCIIFKNGFNLCDEHLGQSDLGEELQKRK